MHAPHVINKQKVRIKTTDEKLAFDLRKQVESKMRNDVIPELEKILDQHFSSDEVVTVEQIKINLGKVSEKIFSEEFTQLVLKQVEVEIEKIKFVEAFPQKENEFEGESTSSLATVKTSSQYKHDALLYFLQNGVLPWWFATDDNSKIENLFPEWTTENIYLWVEKLKSISVNENVIKRFAKHFPSQSQSDFIAELKKYFSKEILIWFENIQKHKEIFTQQLKVPETVFENLLFEIALKLNSKIFDGDDLNGLKQDFIRQLFPSEESKIFFAESIDKIQELNKIFDRKIDLKNPTSANKRQSEIENPLFVKNAGLILLHPFLEVLFNEFKLLNDNKLFIDDGSQQQAVALLNQLVFGDMEIEEWQLPLNKIICGLPIEDFFETETLLTNSEKQECEVLLKQVVQHWTALKNTSVESLRETFIKREGKLFLKEDDWVLQIERQTVDILIDRIPWGISIIKLPWMTNTLHVEW